MMEQLPLTEINQATSVVLKLCDQEALKQVSLVATFELEHANKAIYCMERLNDYEIMMAKPLQEKFYFVEFTVPMRPDPIYHVGFSQGKRQDNPSPYTRIIKRSL